MSNLETDIALIKQKTEFIEEKILHLSKKIDSFGEVFFEGELVKKKDLETHNIQDRWMFGILISMMIGIFIKMFFN